MASRSAAWGVSQWQAGIALFLLVVVVYCRAFACEFIWDDDYYIVDNVTLRTADGLRRMWVEPTATPQYYPLTFTTFWLEHQLWGVHPAGYHVVNVLLHGASAVLLWRVLSLLGIPGAWLAAAVFGIHPVEVESVVWITERKNVLSGLLAIASLRMYLDVARLRGSEDAPSAGWTAYAASLVLFVGALLSKTIVCSLPAVILLLVWYRRGRITLRDVGPLVPFFAVGLVLALNTARLERIHVGAEGEAFEWSMAQRFLIAGPAVWFYFMKIVWPYPLVFMYERWPLDVTGVYWAFPIAALVVAIVAYVGRERWGRGPLTAILYFYGTLFPALGFFNVYPMRYSFVADHFQYLPSLGPIVMLAASLASWGRTVESSNLAEPEPPASPTRSRRTRARRAMDAAPADEPSRSSDDRAPLDPRTALGVAWLAGLSCLTIQQIPVYQNIEALWTNVLEYNPTCFAAHFHLGKIEVQRNRPAAAVPFFENSVKYQTDATELYMVLCSLGTAQSMIGDFPGAEVSFRQALAYRHDDPPSLNGLGMALARQMKFAEATAVFDDAVRWYPNVAAYHLNLANTLAGLGEVESSLGEYHKALRIEPTSSAALLNLGNALARLERFSEAEASYVAALRLDPNLASAQKNLAKVRAEQTPSGPK